MTTNADIVPVDFAAPFRGEVFYCISTKEYLHRGRHGIWMPLNERQLYSRYKHLYDGTKKDADGRTAFERELLKTQDYAGVVWYGPLAGYDAGLIRQNGKPVLVTESPKRIHVCRHSKWDMLRDIMENTLREQLPYYFTWLWLSDKAFMSGNFMPAPALCIAGPKNSHKSFFASVTQHVLGGRVADPFDFMTGRTPFNGDLYGAELLVIDDRTHSRDERSMFAAKLKSMLFGVVQSGRDLYKRSFSLCPFWRMMILLNNAPAPLRMLPTIEDSIADKIMLLLAHHYPTPMPTSTPDERKAFWLEIEPQIEAMLLWLRTEFVPPEECRQDSRTGVTAYKHPDLLEFVQEQSREAQFKELLDRVLFGDDACAEFVEISLTDLETRMLNHERLGKQCSNFIGKGGSTYIGNMMHALHAMYPELVCHKRTKTSRRWQIKRPPGFVSRDPDEIDLS